MTISSAYLFAKQIEAGEAPEGDVLFVNGGFNTQLMPAGFTNFDAMLVPYEQGNGDVAAMQYLIQYTSTNFMKDLVGTPYIAMFKGDHADWWENDGTCLKRIQTTAPQGDIYEVYGHYSAALLIPIIIPNTYKKVHIKYETKGNMIGIQMGEQLSILYRQKSPQTQEPYGYLYRTYDDTMQGLVAGEYEFELDIPNKSGEANFDGYKYVEFNPWIGLEEVYIKKIWFTL